jgi:hypothetical protein
MPGKAESRAVDGGSSSAHVKGQSQHVRGQNQHAVITNSYGSGLQLALASELTALIGQIQSALCRALTG